MHYSAPLTRAYCQLSLLTDTTLFLLVCVFVYVCVYDKSTMILKNSLLLSCAKQQSVSEIFKNTHKREIPLSLSDLLITHFLFTFWGLKWSICIFNGIVGVETTRYVFFLRFGTSTLYLVKVTGAGKRFHFNTLWVVCRGNNAKNTTKLIETRLLTLILIKFQPFRQSNRP